MDCPVIFAGGRIIYRAAPTPDVIGIKEPMLVSIAMDGGDRKIADTIKFHVTDNLCEDDGWLYYSGWTNGNLFPKPLCRISPDFSSGPQFVQDIPGLLCGVQDGAVYYMAAKAEKENNTGIWKRDLSTGQEAIYDKWGVAEDFSYFRAREWKFSAGELRETESEGCKIMYQREGDETVIINVVFE